MVFKINISTKQGKTYKLEVEAPGLIQKEVGETIQGAEISPDLAGYELKITGASDTSGFPAMEEVEGVSLKKVLLGYGKGMKNKPKGLKKHPVKHPEGLRLRKTVRGNVISPAISQINTQVIKEGSKKLSEVFPDQNKAPEPEAPAEEAKAPEAAPVQEQKAAKPEAEPKETKPTEGNPEKERKEAPPTEGNPEKEPKASEKEESELAHPDEEPKK